MKRRMLHRSMCCFALLTVMAACKQSARQSPTAGAVNSSQAINAHTPVMHAHQRKVTQDSLSETRPESDSVFIQAWKLFAHAVKQGNIQQLKKCIAFPLLGAGASCLPHDRLQDPKQDTTGINEKQFEALYAEIFDRQAIRCITAPLSKNDPIRIWQDTGMVSRLIASKRDPATQVYVYHIEYMKGNREGGKYFIFARFHGHYKLAALLYDGMLL
ncbi:hypothetical protein [Arachidicoccus terrestris]|uniref:hypothetical protein n=1 Tax=Arachidicoccus terrestris TaxID=2875539 RepID=UPI001CC74F77|nr:hypothetical protein [Arachidicoccus terrestris]UAY55416.1 hypothetical protein K9M52_18750 [Arachidicoccus terrestris]